MTLVVLDTDAASALILGRAPAALAASVTGHVPAITFVTLGELTVWTLVRR
ncbi:hypothetical protein [Actinomycetospora chiangmaiensis]|uniref:hypothetical protein n=1 Tax=Actinomycetospora chiangmaiensis TaxID=402650 RepID=UPI0003612E50|nr:hypothetical protein [Actinomycetospora chiangmaiensis]